VPDQAAETDSDNAALFAAYTTLTSGPNADKHLTYVHGPQLFSAQAMLDSPTANGLHPSDKGMRDMASFWIPYLQQLLQ
jgi:hypothetical protein